MVAPSQWVEQILITSAEICQAVEYHLKNSFARMQNTEATLHVPQALFVSYSITILCAEVTVVLKYRTSALVMIENKDGGI